MPPRPQGSRPRLLLTGSSGFLGRGLLSALGEEYEVHAVAGRRGFAERLGALAGVPFQAIVHAGFSVDFSPGRPGEPESANVANTRLVRDLARACCRGGGGAAAAPHLVFLSAAGALGVSAVPRARNEDDLGRTDPGFEPYRSTRYVRDKLACEGLFTDEDPFPTTVLYLTTVYAEGMPQATLAPLLGLRRARPVAFCPPGGTSYLAWEDLLEALRRVLALRPRARLVLSSGNARYVDLLEAAARVLGVSGRKLVVPAPPASRRLVRAARAALADRLGWPLAVLESSYGFKYYSCQRACRALGWRPRGDLERGLRAALAPGSRLS